MKRIILIFAGIVVASLHLFAQQNEITSYTKTEVMI
jgi:hypothetical protein